MIIIEYFDSPYKYIKDNYQAINKAWPTNIERSEYLRSWVRGVVQGWRRQLLVNVRGSRGLYGDVTHINLGQHHAKTINIAYIYDITIYIIIAPIVQTACLRVRYTKYAFTRSVHQPPAYASSALIKH